MPHQPPCPARERPATLWRQVACHMLRHRWAEVARVYDGELIALTQRCSRCGAERRQMSYQ
ncbi:hypothetical protein [Pseudomonas sp. NPDC007930]|uniref:hypothetical protein n=1 Tax=Pseudomonas sp. NPDC007930 TaxID=3364417 RepID=UPI0036EAA99C